LPTYLGLGAWGTTVGRWIGVGFAAAWVTVAEAAMASPAVGPRDVVESAIVRVLTLMRDGEVDGTSVPDRWAEIRKIARETFDFNEMSRRALARHWPARTPGEQAELVGLVTALLERSCGAQIEAFVGGKITFVGESVDGRF